MTWDPHDVDPHDVRPESVPNLSARFAALLQSESNTRRDLLALERALGLSGENSKSV